MQLPNYPNAKISDSEGNVSTEFQNYFTQTTTELQLNFSDEGIKLPTLPTMDVNKIGVLPDTPAKTEGLMLYDSTTKEMKVYLNGAWRVVQVV